MDQARQDSLEEVRPGDEDRVFYKLSVPKKLVIMLGGPTMNLLIAVVLLTGVATTYGMRRAHPADQLGLPVRHGADRRRDRAAPRARPSDPVAPANKAGLRPGDRILSIGGTRVSTWDQVRAVVRPNGDRTLPLVVERDGKRLHLTATPIFTDVPVVDDQGKPVLDARRHACAPSGSASWASPRSLELVRQPITAVPGIVGTAVGQTAGVILRIPQKMVGIAQAAFGSGRA